MLAPMEVAAATAEAYHREVHIILMDSFIACMEVRLSASLVVTHFGKLTRHDSHTFTRVACATKSDRDTKQMVVNGFIIIIYTYYLTIKLFYKAFDCKSGHTTQRKTIFSIFRRINQ